MVDFPYKKIYTRFTIKVGGEIYENQNNADD